MALVCLLQLVNTVDIKQTSTSTSKPTTRRCGNSKILTPHFLFRQKIKVYTNSTKKDYEIRNKHLKVFVNRHEKTFERKDSYESCSFVSTENEEGPTPVLFLAAGRSGSSNTWMTLSKLAGKQNEALETVGSNEYQVKHLFDYLGTEEVGAWWVKEHLCEITRYHCDSQIAGFQWKPYGNSVSSLAGKGVLEEIASFSFGGTGSSQAIRVLFMTRNPIDVLISSLKHHHNKIEAHCQPTDQKCLNQHKAAQMAKFSLPTENLLDTLEKAVKHVEFVKSSLSNIGVDYYHTTYEKLYNSDNAEEWMQIFRYIGRGPTHGLTLNDIEKAFPYAKTGNSQKDVLLNYKETHKILQGTEFAHYLHD